MIRGKLWVGTWYAGLIELDPQLLPIEDRALEVGKGTGFLRHFTTADGEAIGTVQGLCQSSDGHLLIAASPDHTTSLGGGLLEFDGLRFRRYTSAQGLSTDFLTGLASDTEGNIWLSSVDGAMKVFLNGFTIFGEADGLLSAAAVFENKSGELCVVADRGLIVSLRC